MQLFVALPRVWEVSIWKILEEHYSEVTANDLSSPNTSLTVLTRCGASTWCAWIWTVSLEGQGVGSGCIATFRFC